MRSPPPNPYLTGLGTMSPKNSKKSGCGIFYKNGVGEWGIGKKDSVKKEDA